MHEEDFWSSWLREDEIGKEEIMAKAERKEEKKAERRKRVEEKEEYETGMVKRRCEGCFSVEAFEIFSEGGDLDSCGGLSWNGLLAALLKCSREVAKRKAEDGMREKEQSSHGQNSYWKEVSV